MGSALSVVETWMGTWQSNCKTVEGSLHAHITFGREGFVPMLRDLLSSFGTAAKCREMFGAP
eukprot:5670374-Amphidinium_carterae.1